MYTSDVYVQYVCVGMCVYVVTALYDIHRTVASILVLEKYLQRHTERPLDSGFFDSWKMLNQLIKNELLLLQHTKNRICDVWRRIEWPPWHLKQRPCSLIYSHLLICCHCCVLFMQRQHFLHLFPSAHRGYSSLENVNSEPSEGSGQLHYRLRNNVRAQEECFCSESETVWWVWFDSLEINQ